MKKMSMSVLFIFIMLCAACAPSHVIQDTLPATEPSGVVSTEPSGSVSTEPSEPLGDLQNAPIGNADTIISNLLTEINLTGRVQSSGQITPPGTPPEVLQIPPADQSIVGKTVTVNLGSNQPAGSFLFRMDSQSDKGLLAVVLRADQVFYIPLLVILETDLNSTTFCQALTSGTDFNATVLSATNISFEEGHYTACNINSDQVAPEEAVDLETPLATHSSSVQFFGKFGGEDVPALYKYDISMSDASERLHSKFQAFSNIFSRFSITF